MNGERGFTLVEALVAFAILAVVSVALYEAMGTSVAGLSRASLFDEAVLAAQSRLQELSVLKTLPQPADGLIEGTDLRWQITPLAEETPEPPEIAVAPLRAQKVRLSVSWEENGRKRSIAVERVLLLRRTPGG